MNCKDNSLMNIHKFSIRKIMVHVSSWSIYFHQLVFEKQERSYVVKDKSKNSVFFENIILWSLRGIGVMWLVEKSLKKTNRRLDLIEFFEAFGAWISHRLLRLRIAAFVLDYLMSWQRTKKWRRMKRFSRKCSAKRNFVPVRNQKEKKLYQYLLRFSRFRAAFLL